MREVILRWLIGGEAKSWKEMFRIAVDCHESCKKVLEREKYLIERYSAIVDRENAILEEVINSFDLQMRANVFKILKDADVKMDGGKQNAAD